MRLGGADLDLAAPTSIAERWDIAIMASNPGMSAVRLHAAAIGLCWPRFRRKHPYRGDPVAYSTLFIDTILSGPDAAKITDLAEPGAEAVRLCIEGLVSVEGAADFADPPADGLTAGG